MTTNSSSPLFNEILNAHMRPVTTQPDCDLCTHLIDLANDNYIRVDTLESVTKGKERGYAH